MKLNTPELLHQGIWCLHQLAWKCETENFFVFLGRRPLPRPNARLEGTPMPHLIFPPHFVGPGDAPGVC